ncbi:MAG TPA: S24 family peptidase [Burkholderiales bacterium]|nr:S24 family peptidase [Burkholderiales bacterium]
MQVDPSYLSRLQDYYARHQVIPSYASIGRLWGISAKSWVANCVGRLKEEGYLGQTPDRRLKPGPRFFERALAHSPVRAGMPNPAPDQGHDLVTIDSYLVKIPSKTTLVRVKGDSMVDAGIFEGDLVVVEQQPAANVGDIVVAIIDDEFTVKYLARDRGEFVLRPANKAYPTLRPKGKLEIFGVMVGLVRRVAR